MKKIVKKIFSMVLLITFLSSGDINSIKNETELRKFLQEKVNLNLDNLHSMSYVSYYNNGLQNKFSKVDLDGNGKIDLLIQANKFIFAIFDKGNNKYITLPVSKKKYLDSEIVKIISTDKLPIIEVKINKINLSKSNTPIFEKIIFREDNFIEYNQNPQNYEIEKIESYLVNYFVGEFYQITILSNKKIHLVKSTNTLRNESNSTMDEEKYEYLVNLLNYIDFPNLENKYRANSTDQSTVYLKITYKNGKEKNISDYGMVGTLGLPKVYKILYDLFKNKKWVETYNKNNIENGLVLTGIINGPKPSAIITVDNKSRVFNVGSFITGRNGVKIIKIDLDEQSVTISGTKNTTSKLKIKN
jgi:hypothetical protein